MCRLRKEWENPESVKTTKKRKHVEPIKEYKEFMDKSAASKKAIPGIPIEGEKNWVIGKYGRPLPIVHVQKGRKLFKHDPSKHCHCIKKIADTDQAADDNTSLNQLTWSLEPDTTIACTVNGYQTPNSERKKKKDKSNSSNFDSDSKNKKSKRKRNTDQRDLEENDNEEDIEINTQIKKNKKSNDGEVIIKNKEKECKIINEPQNPQQNGLNSVIEKDISTFETDIAPSNTTVIEAPIFTPLATSTLSKSIVDQLKHRANIPPEEGKIKTQLFQSLSNKQDKDGSHRNSVDDNDDEEDGNTVNMFDFEWEGISSGVKPELFKREIELREVDEGENSSSSAPSLDNDTDGGEENKKQPSSPPKKRKKEKIKDQNLSDTSENDIPDTNNGDFNMFDFTLNTKAQKSTFNFLENIELKWKNESESESESDSSFSSVHSITNVDLKNDRTFPESNDTQEEKSISAKKDNKKSMESLDKNTLRKPKSNSKQASLNEDPQHDRQHTQRKHDISEEARKKSLEVRNLRTLQNKELVQKALKANAASSNNNKIVFGDDDEDDDTGDVDDMDITKEENGKCKY